MLTKVTISCFKVYQCIPDICHNAVTSEEWLSLFNALDSRKRAFANTSLKFKMFIWVNQSVWHNQCYKMSCKSITISLSKVKNNPIKITNIYPIGQNLKYSNSNYGLSISVKETWVRLARTCLVSLQSKNMCEMPTSPFWTHSIPLLSLFITYLSSTHPDPNISPPLSRLQLFSAIASINI